MVFYKCLIRAQKNCPFPMGLDIDQSNKINEFLTSNNQRFPVHFTTCFWLDFHISEYWKSGQLIGEIQSVRKHQPGSISGHKKRLVKNTNSSTNLTKQSCPLNINHVISADVQYKMHKTYPSPCKEESSLL